MYGVSVCGLATRRCQLSARTPSTSLLQYNNSSSYGVQAVATIVQCTVNTFASKYRIFEVCKSVHSEDQTLDFTALQQHIRGVSGLGHCSRFLAQEIPATQAALQLRAPGCLPINTFCTDNLQQYCCSTY